MNPSSGTLNGLRVIDMTRMLSGPYCTMLLADQGAEVIKIESFAGDTSRGHGPYRDDDKEHLFGGYFQSLNRNKKSIVVDLKSDDGKEIIRRLVKTADVLVENFRPGVMERLGLGYEDLKEINPKLVYGALRGFGDPRSGGSPYQDWPAYDVVAQAMGGMIGITGPDASTPLKIGPGVGDIFPGTMLCNGILSALYRAKVDSEGQFVEVSMYDAIMSLCERIVYQNTIAGIVSAPEGNAHPIFVPFGLFKTRDGWAAICVPNDNFWRKLCTVMQKDELGDDERFATKFARKDHREQVIDIVSEWVGKYRKDELSQLLGGIVPYGPVNTAEDIIQDNHVSMRDMILELEHPGSEIPTRVANSPIKFERTPCSEPVRAPYLGEHTESLLSDLGFDIAQIEKMRASRLIG